MKYLNQKYARYFNEKYKRTGHLFEERFCSIPIESEAYMLTVFRYVLNNPRKANICPPQAYPWSSYNRYGHADSFVDTSIFENLIDSKAEYEAFLAENDEDRPELENNFLGDEWAKTVIRQCLHVESGVELLSMDGTARDEAIRLLKKKGLTIHQIQRLTGISRISIEKACPNRDSHALNQSAGCCLTVRDSHVCDCHVRNQGAELNQSFGFSTSTLSFSW